MKRAVSLIVAASTLSATPLFADGFLIHPDSGKPARGEFTVKYHHVTTKIRGQESVTRVEQVLRNEEGGPEAVYLFPVPRNAFVHSFTMTVGDKQIEGKMLPADEALKIYKEYIRKKIDPALLRYVGRGLYQTSVFPFPRGEERKITVVYSELLPRDGNLVRYVYPLQTEQFSKLPLESVKISVSIENERPIKGVYSPTHPISVSYRDARSATVTYAESRTLPWLDFDLCYVDGEGPVGAAVISTLSPGEAGYYYLMLGPGAPRGTAREPKDIVFVLDCSGSMSGPKIEQAKEALRFIIERLSEADRFSIVRYSNGVDLYSPELLRADAEEKRKARAFVDSTQAHGGTNIDEALRAALGQLTDRSRPSYLIFLTDGNPTVGQTNPAAIEANARANNKAGARLFVFGVGYDLNAALLEKLAADGRGLSLFVKPEENLEEKLASFYTKIDSPIVTNLQVRVEGVRVSHTHPKTLPDLFAGDQVVLIGRYEEGGEGEVVVTGRSQGKDVEFRYRVSFSRNRSESATFLERLWATREIAFLIDEMRIHGKSDELMKEVVALGVRYGIVTEYTSFLADESNDWRDLRSNAAKAQEAFARGNRSESGQWAVQQRMNNGPQNRGSQYVIQNRYYNERGQEENVEDRVQNVQGRGFVNRGGRWIDTQVPERARVRQVRQFSDEWFRLAEENEPLREIFALGNVTVQHAGETIEVVSP